MITFGNIAKGCGRDKKGHFSDTPFTTSPRRQPHNLNASYHNNNI